jgi:c-di-GMP-binding flagellar brake protein YcgR
MAKDHPSVKKEVEFKETHIPGMSILVHCRTVVEKDDFVSTGVLTYAEGDMVEVEIGDYRLFELGDLVKMTVYTPAGIFIFNTTVIAKDEGYLIVINPPENRKKFSEKRKHTRIEVKQEGTLNGIWSQGSLEKKTFEKPLEISVNNISQSGIGFMVEGDLELSIEEQIEIMTHLGTPLSCKAQIKRTDMTAIGILYGAEILDIPAEQIIALRAFILKAQVEDRSNLKKTEKPKRVFK